MINKDLKKLVEEPVLLKNCRYCAQHVSDLDGHYALSHPEVLQRYGLSRKRALENR